MGNYLSSSDITDRMGTDLVEGLTGLSGAALTAELDVIISRQEGVVDGYVGAKYNVPLSGADGIEMAQEWTFFLCQYDIHNRGAGDDVQTKVRLSYEDTIRTLKDISSGKMVIPGEEPPSGSEDSMGLMIGSNDVIFDWNGDAEDTF